MALGGVNTVSGVGTDINSLGLDLQSLMRIILTQLTYQDPLKPMDSFEFMSQLAQFTSLEQARQTSDRIDNLLVVQAATQAVSLLGRTVDLAAAANAQGESGTVQAVSFNSGQPLVTLQTADGRVITDVSPSQIARVR